MSGVLSDMWGQKSENGTATSDTSDTSDDTIYAYPLAINQIKFGPQLAPQESSYAVWPKT